MRVIGLLGGIAAGKSSVAKLLSSEGFPVFSADIAVKSLYRHHQVVRLKLKKTWPEVFNKDHIDWNKLRTKAFESDANLSFLEDLLHPRLRVMRDRFLIRCRRAGAEIAVLDIPLLLETGAWKECDDILWIYAPREMRKERALARGNLGSKEIEMLLNRQADDLEREKITTYKIEATGSLSDLKDNLVSVIDKISSEIEETANDDA